MAGPVVRVDGVRELRASLKRAGADLTDLNAAHKQAAGVVARAARPPRRTGRLAGSIRPGGTRTAAIVRAGGASVPYAGVIEHGWPGHNITARPFLLPAAHETEPAWTAVYTAAIQAIVDKVRGI